ncbi:MAG: DivIVA domain-containing protein [Actinomycetota bacterium]
MPDPLSPHDIARRTFDVARRGYEQQEVRGFLHEVSGLLERLLRTEAELRERADRAENRLAMAERPDEATLIEVLGEETTRVLTSARESATEIRAKAEEAAARMVEEATSQAAEIRSEATKDADARLAEARTEAAQLLAQARTELDRRSAEAEEAAQRIRAAAESEAEAPREAGRTDGARAREEGEADREAARQEGRQMVAEAQAVRERVLRDLAARRKRARIQVEKLNAGRERLLEAYEVVRRTVDEATTELTHSLVDARIAADAAARRVDEEPEPTLEQLDEEVANAGLVDLPIAEVQEGPGERPGDDEDEDSPGPFSGEVPAVGAVAEEPPGSTPTETAPPADAQGAEASEATGLSPTAPEGPRVIELDHGRGRKRRKKGFDGLPPAPLTVVEPPSDSEAVRILAEPAADEATPSDEPSEGEAAEAGAPTEGPDVAEAAEAGPAAEAVEPEIAEAPAEEPEASELEVAPEPEAAEASAGEPDEPEPAAGPEPGAAEEPAEEPEASERDSAEEPDTVPPAEDGSRAADVFARLRAEQTGAAADEAPQGEAEPEPATTEEHDTPLATAEPDGDETAGATAEEPASDEARAFQARASALASVEKDLARRLKRVLADEQNEVLDLLRRAKPKGADDLLPEPATHAARWSDSAREPLADAVGAGADWSGGKASSSADLAEELGRSLTAPLRERIERSFAAADGNLDEVADRVRALYREWKGQRLSEAVADAAAAGYARGVLDGVPAGGQVHWVVDPSAGPCPDCDDNVLAGPQAKGEPFPTGGAAAPAHPGCHCLVLPVET